MWSNVQCPRLAGRHEKYMIYMLYWKFACHIYMYYGFQLTYASTITHYERGDPTDTTVRPVEFEKWPVQVQDLGKSQIILEEIHRIYHKIKETWKIPTCNRLHFETLGIRSIKPNLSPDTDYPSVTRKELEQEAGPEQCRWYSDQNFWFNIYMCMDGCIVCTVATAACKLLYRSLTQTKLRSCHDVKAGQLFCRVIFNIIQALRFY